jgi:hypothetical protein
MLSTGPTIPKNLFLLPKNPFLPHFWSFCPPRQTWSWKWLDSLEVIGVFPLHLVAPVSTIWLCQCLPFGCASVYHSTCDSVLPSCHVVVTVNRPSDIISAQFSWVIATLLSTSWRHEFQKRLQSSTWNGMRVGVGTFCNLFNLRWLHRKWGIPPL